MKLMRRGVALALVAAGAMVLSSCGSNPTTSSSSSTASVDCGGKTNLTGEGSSAQKNAIDVFVAAFAAKCQGQNVAYNPTGSGAGVKQFNAGLVDFGGSDSPLSESKGEVAAAATRCKNNPAWHIPLVAGPVAVAYKLDGVSSLTLNGETIAKIFNGGIKTW
ncbi:MAG: substrate-binding domain-containing protein, partial [Pseudonocardiales bacterium]|nr:substrate-binding domain-containing protein [Pseudonocardiales bacterium]